MVPLSHSVIFSLVLCGVLGSDKLRLYNPKDTTEKFTDLQLSATCQTYQYPIQWPFQEISVRASSCAFVYSDTDCDGDYIKITWDRPDVDISAKLDFLVTELNPTSPAIKGQYPTANISYHLCTEDEYRGYVTVDIFDGTHYKELVDQYRDVCGCIVLPTEIHGKVGSVDNHGSCLDHFISEDCIGNPTWMQGGIYNQTGNMYNFTSNDGASMNNVKSFRPCNIPESCPRLNDTVPRSVTQNVTNNTTHVIGYTVEYKVYHSYVIIIVGCIVGLGLLLVATCCLCKFYQRKYRHPTGKIDKYKENNSVPKHYF